MRHFPEPRLGPVDRITGAAERPELCPSDHTDGGVVDIPGALLLDAWTCRLAIQTEKSALLRVWDAGDTPAILSVPRRPLYVVDHERFNRSFRRF